MKGSQSLMKIGKEFRTHGGSSLLSSLKLYWLIWVGERITFFHHVAIANNFFRIPSISLLKIDAFPSICIELEQLLMAVSIEKI